MKCPVCEQNNQKSMLKMYNSSDRYVGKEREWHYNEQGNSIPSQMQRFVIDEYQCSNGHIFKIETNTKTGEIITYIIKDEEDINDNNKRWWRKRFGGFSLFQRRSKQ
jgi:hypothetical protein